MTIGLDFSATICILLLAMLAGPGRANQHSEKSRLGDVHFPISCSAELQEQFSRGVALLHSFWYDKANKVFVEIKQKDPQCVMAYWGEVMSLYSPFSGPPRGRVPVKAHSVLEKAVAIGAKTQRER